MSKPTRKELRTAIRRLVRAAVEDSWSGAGHPEDEVAVERELELANQKLSRLLDRLYDSVEDNEELVPKPEEEP